MLEAIADDPLQNRQWMVADSPFQALAATFEIVAMWRHGPGFVSSLPCRVDGTCNGLQHLAILSGDADVAEAVNVLPTEEPHDIYQKIADVTTRHLEVELATPQDEQAAALGSAWLRITGGKLPRSLTKRPVMILPYGGTLQAFTEYTRDWLEENSKPEWGEIDTFRMATFMSKRLWYAVQTAMPGPMRIMRWLKSTAALAAEDGAPLYWTTPAGFVVRHFYGVMTRRNIKTNLDGRQLQIRVYSPTDTMSKKDQARGIAPNFVHSQDASILIGCVRSCVAQGIVSVTTIHDAFGTVAADMGLLSATLRACFVANYEQDVLGSFAECCRAVAPSITRGKIEAAPVGEGIDLQSIEQSDYFFA